MANPRLTGISSITGKTVSIRHATDADLIEIRDYLVAHGGEGLHLSGEDVVVAAEDDRIIGFGVLERGSAPPEAGCVTIVEDGRRRGIGASIVKHLTDYAPVGTVYADPGRSRYLGKLGFRKKHPDPGRLSVIARMCRLAGRKGSSLAAYERS
jgi:N-acetylglutamate synthase-like GNAT family acetyltransferase